MAREGKFVGIVMMLFSGLSLMAVQGGDVSKQGFPEVDAGSAFAPLNATQRLVHASHHKLTTKLLASSRARGSRCSISYLVLMFSVCSPHLFCVYYYIMVVSRAHPKIRTKKALLCLYKFSSSTKYYEVDVVA